MAQQTFVSQTFALLISGEFSFFPLKPQTPTLFSLAQDCIWALIAWLPLSLHVSVGLLYVCNYIWSSPVNLSYANLIIRPSNEPRREARKIFPPLQCYVTWALLHLPCSGFHTPDRVQVSYLWSLPFIFQIWLVPLFSVLTIVPVTYMSHNNNVELFLRPLLLENSNCKRNLSAVLCPNIS